MEEFVSIVTYNTILVYWLNILFYFISFYFVLTGRSSGAQSSIELYTYLASGSGMMTISGCLH